MKAIILNEQFQDILGGESLLLDTYLYLLSSFTKSEIKISNIIEEKEIYIDSNPLSEIYINSMKEELSIQQFPFLSLSYHPQLVIPFL